MVLYLDLRPCRIPDDARDERRHVRAGSAPFVSVSVVQRYLNCDSGYSDAGVLHPNTVGICGCSIAGLFYGDLSEGLSAAAGLTVGSIYDFRISY